MNVLEVRGLVKRFGALAATDGVDLDLRAGEVHALIGPNGAGKTTLIAQIAGGLAPDAGVIRLGGRDVTGLAAPARARLGLARTFQITALLHGLSALENATLAAQGARPGALSPFRRRDRAEAAEAAARAALAEVGLTARADAPVGALAHGEQRALDLAMALAQGPRALLLDEPMAGAGRDETETLVATLRRLKGRVAMLLVEHDMGAVFALADRVSVLVAGRVVASGAPEAIRCDPGVRAAYLGEDA